MSSSCPAYVSKFGSSWSRVKLYRREKIGQRCENIHDLVVKWKRGKTNKKCAPKFLSLSNFQQKFSLRAAVRAISKDLRSRHLLGEEVVELVGDPLAERVLILVIHTLVQSGKFVIFQCLLLHHVSVRLVFDQSKRVKIAGNFSRFIFDLGADFRYYL